MTFFQRQWIFIVVLFCFPFVSGLAQERYSEPVFHRISTETFTYSDTLQLDYYSAAADTLSSKPLLLLVHGGGFAIGKRDNPLERAFSMDMAKRGFAVASISYRLLRKGKSFGCDCTAKEKIATFNAAAEDILLAADFLASRSDELRFDPEKIVLVGSSAGAEAVLNTVFMQYHHNFNELPYKDLKFAGLISFAGAVLDINYITRENGIPTLLFHGEKDRLVPFGIAAHHYCDSNAKGYLILHGSAAIAKRLEQLGQSYQLMYDPDGNHDWANLAYSRTGTVAKFILRTIINDQNIRSRIGIKPEK